MTHDELLAKLNSAPNADTCWKIAIIREVIELHKPPTYSEYAKFFNPGYVEVMREDCKTCDLKYPCPTIQVIEKELV